MLKNGRTILEDASKVQAFSNVFVKIFAYLHISNTTSLGFVCNGPFLTLLLLMIFWLVRNCAHFLLGIATLRATFLTTRYNRLP